MQNRSPNDQVVCCCCSAAAVELSTAFASPLPSAFALRSSELVAIALRLPLHYRHCRGDVGCVSVEAFWPVPGLTMAKLLHAV